ncbi:hypothetical protein J7K55_08420 [Candidatus Aerophobetes bacterium]|nr:hypothetical protein [Candidatus Aerophobetes bacterium]
MNDANLKMKKAIFKKVEEKKANIYEIIRRFVQIPSVTGEEKKAQRYMEELYSLLGLKVEILVPSKKRWFIILAM